MILSKLNSQYPKNKLGFAAGVRKCSLNEAQQRGNTMQNTPLTDAITEYMKNIDGHNIPTDIIEAAIKAMTAYYSELKKN